MVGTTPPPLQGPSSKEKKYDRQLRLWAASGQSALEEAHVLLVNSGPGVVGIETLKNLVLPGIGSFTIVDEAKVTESDLGLNFFLDEDSLGQSRAKRCCELLEELNPDVHGHHINVSVETFLSMPESLGPYSLLLLTPFISFSSQSILRQYSHANNIPTFYLHSIGFYSRFSLSLPHVFPIVDTHPDPTSTTDLRLLSPWPELTDLMLEKTASIDEGRSDTRRGRVGVEPERSEATHTMSDHEHGHVPYVLLLLYYLNEWRKAHDGANPQNYREKKDFEKLVRNGARTSNPEGGEENYDEAIATILKSLNPSTLSTALKDIFQAEECRALVRESSNFWIIANAIHQFYKKHSDLPLPGSLPDMKAKSGDYIRLQNIYKSKARNDVAEVLAVVRKTEDTLGRTQKPIEEKEIEAFCKGAGFVKLVRGRPLHTVQTKSGKHWGDRAKFAWQELNDPDSQMALYIAFLAQEAAIEETDAGSEGFEETVQRLAKEIIEELQSEAMSEPSTDESHSRVSQIIQEMARAGAGELHNISALTGGMVAQEVIKVITKQKSLSERAVVTTCSHIFCTSCSDSLGLSNPSGSNRICPACDTLLSNPDDAVTTHLNPTEDYKTSVLSGLSPGVIVECAGRGLAFWSYQATQEIVYQEYLAKTLTDKYATLSSHMDKIIHDANTEISTLHNKLSSLQLEQNDLQKKNHELVEAFREKSRKHIQTQELYDKLKRRTLLSQVQNAASEAVDQTIHSSGDRFSDRAGKDSGRQYPQFFNDRPTFDPNQTRDSDGSGGSGGRRGPMAPPLHGWTKYAAPGFSSQNEPLTTPTQHRERLPAPGRSTRPPEYPPGHLGGFASNNMHTQTPMHRQPLGSHNGNALNNSSMSGYGMSAGMKAGRQQSIGPMNGDIRNSAPRVGQRPSVGVGSGPSFVNLPAGTLRAPNDTPHHGGNGYY
ncbi:MAG: hypothetical protein M1812_000658 [Candelaria pacifica]|nr:MAG: hypothetical protein M1812_000658 [Candelaria pacifica]